MLPKKIGNEELNQLALREDFRCCRQFGRCGIGKQGLYFGDFWRSRGRYLPLSSVERLYKRVAMSRGGFSGKGTFASIPYLVAEYEGGKEWSCSFKNENSVDSIIESFHEICPSVPTLSKRAEHMLAEKQRRVEERRALLQSAGDEEPVRLLQEAADQLERRPRLYKHLSLSARERRQQENSSFSYIQTALTFFVGAVIALAGGLYLLLYERGGGVSLVLFALAAFCLYSAINVFPTKKKNWKKANLDYENAVLEMERYVQGLQDFPLPACYAHPVILLRMQEIIAMRRARGIYDALDVLRNDLMSMNASISVEQEEYDEIIAIKPLFLAAGTPYGTEN